MAGALNGQADGPARADDRLESWKSIAAHLNRDVTTVQRWEKREGMPVHRHLHEKAGSVYAFKPELDAWLRGRTPQPPPPAADEPHRFAARATLGFGLALAALALAVAGVVWFKATRTWWQDPIADARFQRLTEFDGVAPAAAVSRDGRFAAFLSDRDGRMDVWVTQVGSGQFHNLTRGIALELVNRSVRMLGFSPDGSLVTFWARAPGATGEGGIGVWAVPVLGGAPKPYLEGIAEADWSADGSRLVYHTPGPGDPLFVTDADRRSPARGIFTAPAGLHAHFPVWAPGGRWIYFVQGALPDRLDIWRISPEGRRAERLTEHHGRVSHPVLLNDRTLVYLASDADGSGPWLYGMDVERRVSHKLSVGADRYSSLSASADGRRLVATLATPKRTLWRVRLPESPTPVAVATRVQTPAGAANSPRFGPGWLLFVSRTGDADRIWKIDGDASTEIWTGPGARVLGGPAVSPDGQRIAFSVHQHDRSLLYVMGTDGTGLRRLSDALDLQGSPAWDPDGRSITTAAVDAGEPRLFRFPLDGHPPTAFVREYSIDPAWSPDGRFVVYSGPDIGTRFSVRAVAADASAQRLPVVSLSRGARRLAFLPGGRVLVVLRGEIEHKDLWAIDLDTGAERPLTNLPADFAVADFDVSPDGREIVVERMEERSDVVLLELRRR